MSEERELRERIRALIPLARREAAKVGSLSGAWDAIFDGEAYLSGQRTICTPEQIAESLATFVDIADAADRLGRRMGV